MRIGTIKTIETVEPEPIVLPSAPPTPVEPDPKPVEPVEKPEEEVPA